MNYLLAAWAVLFLFFIIVGLLILIKIGKGVNGKPGEIKITNLSKNFAETIFKATRMINGHVEEEEETLGPTKKLFVLNFKGDIQASKVDSLKEEVSTVLQLIKVGDEVLLNLESPGGVVHGYGLAAAQLARFRNKAPLTVTVDKVAASGGYMMAAVANKIVAAPFAILGSIGVVIEFPNFAKLLDRVGVKYEQLTAGDHKRTISSFVPNSPEKIEKTKEDLAKTHELFKAHIHKYRPGLDIDSVATGETWYGSEAVANKLVDEVMVSDDFILTKMKDFEVFQVEYKITQPKMKILSGFSAKVVNDVIEYWLEKSVTSNFTDRK